MEDISKSYAFAWSENQGNYSAGLAKKLLTFAKLKKLNINSALDICCGSGNFLFELQKEGIKCSGTEFLDTYIEYDKKTFPNMTFIKTENILDFDNTKKYDLISCNHDVLNMLSSLDEWNIFLKKAYAHLNDGGMLLFDFYTKKKLENWNEVIYTESDKLDYIKDVKTTDNKTTITHNYYVNINQEKDNSVSAIDKEYSLNNYDNKYIKSSNVNEEYYFETENIFDLIKKNGYRYLIPTDSSLSPISELDVNRLHIIAIKREH